MMSRAIGLLKLMLYVCHTVNVQGRGLYLGEFICNTLHFGLGLNAFAPMSFKPNVTIGTTLSAVWYQFK